MIQIVGAGLSGLLAANMLLHRDTVIHEAQPDLPNNHTALLRFRSPVVGQAIGIPFKKVQMIKYVSPWKNPVADALAYSYKNSGEYRSDRSLSNASAERYIAPDDLIQCMAERVTIQYNSEFKFDSSGPIISTIPMPNLMKLLHYPDRPAFSLARGTNIIGKIKNCDAYVSVYVPNPDDPFSRISITGDKVIVEIPITLTSSQEEKISDIFRKAMTYVGITGDARLVRIEKQDYAKILPVDEKVRKDFIYWASSKHNVYSLGRFATWRPSLLLDDLVHDVRLIDQWISGGSYERAKRRAS